MGQQLTEIVAYGTAVVVERAPASRRALTSHLRIGDADRDRIAAVLGTHYAAGRLDTAGLSERLDIVYAAELLGAGRGGARRSAATRGRLPDAREPPPPRRSRGPGAGWIPTTERFRDPTTRRLMRVWVDPTDATRHYVAEAAA